MCDCCFPFPKAPAPEAPVPKKKLPLPLNVGFAILQLKESQENPRLDLCITSTDGDMTEDGSAAMLDFLDFVLELEDVVSEGFQLTFDEFQILTGPSLMTRVVCWSCESGRTSKWVQRCAKAARKRWKVIMTATSYQQVSRYLLQAVFQLYPPPCPTYLLTDEHPTVDDSNPDMQIFRPADTLNLARLGENLQQEVAAQSDSAGHVHLPAEQSRQTKTWKKLPDKINVGFALVSQGFDGVEGYLKIEGLEGAW
ncbi:unnamed protein product [Effrenium voratum]|nr:unnamed protein product [Effrenium voratum]